MSIADRQAGAKRQLCGQISHASLLSLDSFVSIIDDDYDINIPPDPLRACYALLRIVLQEQSVSGDLMPSFECLDKTLSMTSAPTARSTYCVSSWSRGNSKTLTGTPKHAKLTMGRIRAILAQIGAKTIGDLSPE